MKDILFLNHKQKQCGVYQYGLRSANILKKSTKYNFIYCEVENSIELDFAISKHSPIGIIYNHHPATMGWLNNIRLQLNKHDGIFNIGIYHEDRQTLDLMFDSYIITDCTFIDSGTKFSIPRPLFEDIDIKYPIDPTGPLRIGSFGFGFKNKGFDRLVKTVNEQFDDEDNIEINLHIPFAHYGDALGYQSRSIANECRSHITKANIKLNISHHFLTDYELLSFLASNDINCFFYDEMIGRGLSSVIDYALSTERPIAITNTHMFRHIRNTSPNICIENSSFMQILNPISDPLKPYKEKWSNDHFISKYEQIVDNTKTRI